MQNAHYFLTSVEIMDNHSIFLSLPVALVSQQSVYRVFEESDEVYQLFLQGRLFAVKLDNHTCMGRLVRELGPEGSHYNLRLVQLPKEVQAAIDANLSQYGVNSPWKRRTPRLHVAHSSSYGEVPQRVFFPRFAGYASGNVVNFSCHGLLFEFFCTGPSLGEHIGQRIYFDLTTSHKQQIHGIEAQITRIYDEVISPGRVIRGLGVKFLRMQGDKRERYYEMVLANAAALKSVAFKNM